MINRYICSMKLLLALIIFCTPFLSLHAENVDSLMQRMTLREKVGQLFMVRPESIVDTLRNDNFYKMIGEGMKALTKEMKSFYRKYPAGGFCLHELNIADSLQLLEFTSALHALPYRPLISLDEEGGRITRIAWHENFHVPRVENMGVLAEKGEQAVYNAANAIGTYCKFYGFDIDFAPVADVNTNPENIVIGDRAFSSDPEKAAILVSSYVRGLQDAGVCACLKHFPGHGDTNTDTHYGYSETRKTWEQIDTCEMVPFRAGIVAGAQLVMTAHIAVPKLTKSELPSTLSSKVLEGKLRGELGYEGVIVTDAMEMGAIIKQYSSAEACVKAIQAGADILLMPRNYKGAFDAVVRAVKRGVISKERLNQSVRRILLLKQNLQK